MDSVSYTHLDVYKRQLFPRHDRVVYLDVDVLLNGDVAELYDADLHLSLIHI